MIAEKIEQINGKLFVTQTQTTYYIFDSTEDKGSGKSVITTSDGKMIDAYKRQMLLSYLKDKLVNLSSFFDLKAKVGYDNSAGYVVKITPQSIYDMDEVTDIVTDTFDRFIKDSDIQVTFFADSSFSFDEVFFEIGL